MFSDAFTQLRARERAQREYAAFWSDAFETLRKDQEEQELIEEEGDY